MSNPLVIPEILENIFSYLPTTALVRITYVNKLWRLEARNKLYQNRNEIIYNLHKWFLNTFRLHGGFTQALFPDMRKSITSVQKFQATFQLNIRAELLIKRAQLQDEKGSMAVAYNEKIQAYVESRKLFIANPENIVNYANYRKLDRECVIIQRAKPNLHRELVNFEYFLSRIDIITDPDEIGVIIDKCTDLRDEEEEMQWQNRVEGLLEYWGDSDPDDV